MTNSIFSYEQGNIVSDDVEYESTPVRNTAVGPALSNRLIASRWWCPVAYAELLGNLWLSSGWAKDAPTDSSQG